MKTEPGTEFFDTLEQRPPAEREQAQFAQLRALLARVQAHSAYGQEQLSGFDAAALLGRAELARLPILRKADIATRQARLRPFGGLTLPDAVPRKLFQSPGPIYEPEGAGTDPWRLARALFAAGFRAGDVVHNSFSYHLTPAGSMLEGGALALGCSVLPAGVGQTELQLQAARELGCNAYTGTPSFLRILLERAEGQPLGFKKALVSGEAFPASLQDWVTDQGVQAYQCYATADCGLIAFETAARAGLVVDEGVIVEIVRPGSGEPLPDGEVGEVLVTRLDAAYPLLRYATGDLSAFVAGPSPCGRSNRRLRGWLGRADQSAKVRGLFVHAAQVQQLRERFPELGGRMRWVIEGQDAQDVFTVWVEAPEPAEGLGERLVQAARDITRLRAELRFVNELPNDGRLIDDRRAR